MQQDRALSAGFRNSGTVFGRHGNVTLAVRGTHGLEVPLSDEQGLLVSEHVSSIVDKSLDLIEHLFLRDKFQRTFLSIILHFIIESVLIIFMFCHVVDRT